MILIQQGGVYASFARTFYLENRQISTCVIDIPFHHPNAVNIILSEITATDSYTEVYYDENGKRWLYRICHAKLLTTHACKACTARL
ncbi:hypothetical protein MSj_02192 [Microcystis aeruginosa Sj]|uniref:Uncharacterized protein n=1 Tax=Microcystis aeruginosa Sj TaxID=1979544 RepID=A0A2Z6UMT6_MICAE|nr:hypothetical protein MSj_02192 [Microcystis aeruginosa Sj]